jgi:hypothetical protein
LKGVNPSSVSVELFNFLPGNNTVVAAAFNQTASANNPHIDVWSVNIDQSALEEVETFVPVLRLRMVAAADANVCQVPSLCHDRRSVGIPELPQHRLFRPASVPRQ